MEQSAIKIQTAWRKYACHKCVWCEVGLPHRAWVFFKGLCDQCEHNRFKMAEEYNEIAFGVCDKCGEYPGRCECCKDCGKFYCNC